MPSKPAPRRKPRRRMLRNEEEREILNQIASLFDEREKAFSLLKRSINNGYMSTPDKDIPIQDFLKLQREQWTNREDLHISHSFQYLRNSILSNAMSSTGMSESFAGNTLDEIEHRRDMKGQYRGKYGKHHIVPPD